MKIATTKERILQFIEYKKISKQSFFKETGLKRGFLDADKLLTSIPDTFIATIIAIYPEINPIWLLLGQGEMLISIQPTTTVPQSAEAAVYYKMYKEKEAKIEAQAEEIGALKKTVQVLEEKILGLQSNILPVTEYGSQKAFDGPNKTRKRGVADSGSAHFAEQ